MDVPNENSVYSKQEYWDKRYGLEESFDWFAGYETFKDLLRGDINRTDKILVLGCGNSKMSFDMYCDGYHCITNMDYSSVVIDGMREKHKTCTGMTWKVMDIHCMTFEPQSFDVVLEKGTLDALMVDEKDPWKVSDRVEVEVEQILQQISCMLKNGGKFISITFSQPHFRQPLYAKQCFKWSITQNSVGEYFHYFYYTAQKGGLLSETECEAELQRSESRSRVGKTTLTYLEDDNSDAFLLKLGCGY